MGINQKTRWVKFSLSNNYDSNMFELLCNKLLMSSGYSNIVPIGGVKDNARDAEIRVLEGKDLDERLIYFQYSLQKTWKDKLKYELNKLSTKQKEKISKYIFVSSQDITGYTKDQLEDEFPSDKDNFKLEVLPYSWLESKILQYPDILADFFEWSDDLFPTDDAERIYKAEFELSSFEELLEAYYDGNYEHVVAKGQNILKDESITVEDKFNILKIKGWSECLLYRYKEALLTIMEALEIKEEPNIKGMHACILAEHGISTQSNISVQMGREIFEKLAEENPSWESYYNLGNTESELREHEQAIKSYKKALSYNANSAQTWKNLASAYFNIGEHDNEEEAMDKALEINPDLVEALISKGVTALQIKSDYATATSYFEKAFKVDIKRTQKWPAIYNWYSVALWKNGDIDKALEIIDTGINLNPELSYLTKTKSEILKDAWRQSKKAYIDKAEKHFKTLHTLSDNVLDYIIELLEIYAASEDKKKFILLATKLFDKRFTSVIPFSYESYLEIAESFFSYQRYLSINENTVDYTKQFNELDIKENDFDVYLELESRLLFAKLLELFGDSGNPNFSSKMKDELVKLFKQYSNSIIEHTTKLYPTELSKDNVEDSSKYMTEVILVIPLLVIVFVSRQIGWIAGTNQMQAIDLPNELKGRLDFDKWRVEMSGEILRVVDEKYQIFGRDKKLAS